jgi:hypothetical protein
VSDTFTPNLNLTKPAVGASRDTWGTKTNSDWDLVDAVFAGAGSGTSVGLNVGSGKTLSVAGTLTASGTVTLPAAATAGGATIVSTTGTQTLTNKTLTNPAINGFTGDTSVINIGSGQIYKDASGNVGIGTTAPGTRLTVAASVEAGARFLGNGLTSAGLFVGYNSAAYVYNDSNTPLIFGTNAAESMRITADGNVGIGTSSASTARLVVISPPNSPSLLLSDATQSTLTILHEPGNLLTYQAGGSAVQRWVGNSVERMRIDASGNVGIGTTAPTAPLDVNGNVAITGTARRITGDFSNATNASRTLFQTNVVNNTSNVGIMPNGSGVSSNLLLYGGSDPDNASVAQFGMTNSGTETRIGSFATGTGTVRPVTFVMQGAERMRITADGEVYIAGTTDQGAFNLQVNGTGVWGAGAYTNGSDARIKDDIAPIASGLDVVAKLRPVQFRYKESWSKDRFLQPGFIAQELQEALADQPYVEGVVHQGPEYMSVSYQTLIPVLTKAVQELTAKLEAAEARIANLENR